MEIINGSQEALEEEAVGIIASELEEVIFEKEKAILALCGGRSVKGIFEKLRKQDIEWSKVHFFLVDERYAPLNHKNSNYKLLYENLLKYLLEEGKITDENIHSFNHKKTPKEYTKKLEKHGDEFDVLLLSSGEDGHIAALYPNHHSIKNNTRGFLELKDSPKPPEHRLTASRKLIESSKHCLLLFFGENKRDAYDKFLDKNISVEESPNKAVRNIKKLFVLNNF